MALKKQNRKMTLHQITNECPAMTTKVPLLLRTMETDDSFSHSPSSQQTQRFQNPCGKHPPASASFTHLRDTPGTYPTDTPLCSLLQSTPSRPQSLSHHVQGPVVSTLYPESDHFSPPALPALGLSHHHASSGLF